MLSRAESDKSTSLATLDFIFLFFRLTTVQLPFHKTEVKYSGNVGVQSLMTDFFCLYLNELFDWV